MSARTGAIVAATTLFAASLTGCPSGEGDFTPGDDDTSPADDDTSAGDDDTTGDDDSTPGPDPRFDDLAARVESERAAAGAPGAAVAVLEDGRVTFARGFGSRGLEGSDPVLPSTLFRIASCTKAMTAAATLQLVDEGQLDLSAPVQDVLPDFHLAIDPEWAAAVSARDLLTHGSGIYDYLEIDANPADGALVAWVTGFLGDSLIAWYPAGTMYNYSNPNFSIAGAMVEERTGTPYVDRMQEALLRPLGLSRTMFRPEDVLADGDYAVALGWDWTGESAGLVPVEPGSYDNAWGRPAGYAWSSVDDMAAWIRFLLDGNEAVVSDGARAAMLEPQLNMEDLLDLDWYGYGMGVYDGFFLGDDWFDTRLLGHSGAISGFSSLYYVVPSTGFAVVFLASTDGAYFPEATALALSAFAGLPAPSAPPDLTVDLGGFGAFTGLWDDTWNIGVSELTFDGTSLRLQNELLDIYGFDYDPVLQPYAPDNFVWELEGARHGLTFIRDEAGDPAWMRLRFSVSTRVEGEAAARGVPAMSPDRLRALLRASAPAGPSERPGPLRFGAGPEDPATPLL